jgi:hypothetical protein
VLGPRRVGPRIAWFSAQHSSVARHVRPTERTDPAALHVELLERQIDITSGQIVGKLLGVRARGRVQSPEQRRPVLPDCREQPARIETT